VVREGVGAGRRNDPSLYAHMNNKRKKTGPEYKPHSRTAKNQTNMKSSNNKNSFSLDSTI
jgi:hypothetical protein